MNLISARLSFSPNAGLTCLPLAIGHSAMFHLTLLGLVRETGYRIVGHELVPIAVGFCLRHNIQIIYML